MRARELSRRWLWPLVGVVAFVVACLLLGWWQWDRSQSAGGTLRNLAYALEWPSFAAFAIYMLYRAIVLERAQHENGSAAGQSAADHAVPDESAAGSLAAEPSGDGRPVVDSADAATVSADASRWGRAGRRGEPDANPLADNGSGRRKVPGTAAGDAPAHAPASGLTPARRGGWWAGAAARFRHRADDTPVGPVRIGPPRPADPTPADPTPTGSTPTGSTSTGSTSTERTSAEQGSAGVTSSGPNPGEPGRPAAAAASSPGVRTGGEDTDTGARARTVWDARRPPAAPAAEPDDELASYNEYLARLHATDQRNARDRAV